MRLSALSIERPVLAAVATLLLMLFGLLSYSRLPVREYPDTTFPIVSVMTVYPSADAQLVETDITSVLVPSAAWKGSGPCARPVVRDCPRSVSNSR